MNEALVRWFVSPERATPPPAPMVVGVVAQPRDLAAAAGGVAAELRARHRAGAALVCGTPGTGFCAPASSALARRLGRRGLTATACGALCHVPLSETRRAIAAVEAPAVVAVSSRDGAVDELLDEVERVVLAVPLDADGAYVDLALASLASVGPSCDRVAVPAGAVARRLAVLGLHRLRPEPSEAFA